MIGKRPLFVLVAVLLLVSQVLAGCGATATPTTVPTNASTVPAATAAPTTAPETAKPTTVPATVTAKAPAPAVGGTLIYAIGTEPSSLDAQADALGLTNLILRFIGATLTSRAPDGTIVPYACESWKTSPDGLQWDFLLKRAVKFTTGEPVTAKDWAYTLSRLVDPATKSPNVGFVGPLAKAEALDDYTLRLTLKAPFYPLLFGLAQGYNQVLSEAAIQKAGSTYGRNPVGAGPYYLKEWRTGDRIIMERNPDYQWGPSYAHEGPWYVQTIVFREIPEMATLVAGLESGEIDSFLGTLLGKDVQRVKDTGNYSVYEGLRAGMYPGLYLNTARAPFDDVRVRQAISCSIDRQTLIAAAEQGFAIPQYGPLSPSVLGYWSGVEKIGYQYDEQQAERLLADAGYVAGADGIMVKDGKPMKLDFLVWTGQTAGAEIVQAMLKKIGISVQIQMLSISESLPLLQAGNYDICTGCYVWGEADIMYNYYHSSQLGALNLAQVKDSELDKLLELTRSSIDPVQRQEYVNQAQKMIVEKAYNVPLYSAKQLVPLNNRVKGAVWSATSNWLYLDDAHIQAQ